MTKHVTLHTIAAGPNLLADAGSTISVDDKFAKLLTDGKFGTEASAAQVAGNRRRAKTESAVFDPAAEHAARMASEETGRAAAEETAKSVDSIKAALAKLDPANDDHWTAGGLPAVGEVKHLTGSTTLTRADIEAADAAFARPEPTEAETAAKTTARTRGPRTSNT